MLLCSSPEELKRRLPSLPSARAQEIFDFFHHKVNPNFLLVNLLLFFVLFAVFLATVVTLIKKFIQQGFFQHI